MSTETLARLAGLSERTVRRARRGEGVARPATLRAIREASRQAAEGEASRRSHLAACYRVVIGLLARAAGVDPDAALRADPRRERGPVARVRMRAFHVLASGLEVAQAEIGRVAGVTRAAVSKSLREVEDECDADPSIEKMLDDAARIVGGVR